MLYGKRDALILEIPARKEQKPMDECSSDIAAMSNIAKVLYLKGMKAGRQDAVKGIMLALKHGGEAAAIRTCKAILDADR